MADRVIEIIGGGFGQATSPTSKHGPRSPLYFWTEDVLLCGRHANGMRLQPFTNADREAGYGKLGCPFCHGGALAGTHSQHRSQKQLTVALDEYAQRVKDAPDAPATATRTGFHTITEIKHANRALGHHFFDADTLRHFNSIVYPTVYAGRYFITSEQDDGMLFHNRETGGVTHAAAWDGARRWSIRLAQDDGRIRMIDDDYEREYGRYTSWEEADAAARELV